MNTEFEVTCILRGGKRPAEKAQAIMRISNFRKENIISVTHKGGRNASEIYGNLLQLDKNKQNKVKGGEDGKK